MHVEAHQLDVLLDAQAHRVLQGEEERDRGHRHPGEDGGDADHLAEELIRATPVEQALLPEPLGVLPGEEPDGQRAEDAAHAVHRHGTHRVVDLEDTLDEVDGQHDQDAGHQADDDGRLRRHGRRTEP